MVNLIGRALVQLSERVVRQLGEMHHRVETLNILRRRPALILRESQRPRVIVVVEPAVSVEAAIHPESVEPTFHEPRPEHGADIPINAGNQYSHSFHSRLVQNGNQG